MLIDPNASVVEEQKKKARQQMLRDAQRFREHHPLAKMYASWQYMVWAREDRQWWAMSVHADALCSAYANLSEEEQESFRDVLPNPPDYLGERSTGMWIAYLASLIAVRERRERLGARIYDVIVGGGRGEDFLPTVYRSLSSIDPQEPSF